MIHLSFRMSNLSWHQPLSYLNRSRSPIITVYPVCTIYYKDNDMLFFSSTSILDAFVVVFVVLFVLFVCLFVFWWQQNYDFSAYTVDLLIKAYHQIPNKKDKHRVLDMIFLCVCVWGGGVSDSDVLFDSPKKISIFDQKAHHRWLSKGHISFCLMYSIRHCQL